MAIGLGDVLRRVGDPGEHVGKPGLRVDVVELCRHDQRGHHRGTVGTAFGASKQPGFSAERKATQRPFGGIVGQADPAILDEPSEPVPVIEQVLDRLDDGGRARQPRKLVTQPTLQSGQQRRAVLLSNEPAPIGTLAVDAALDVEQRVDSSLGPERTSNWIKPEGQGHRASLLRQENRSG